MYIFFFLIHTYQNRELIKDIACKITEQGCHIEFFVANVRNHNQTLGIIWLIFGRIKSKTPGDYR